MTAFARLPNTGCEGPCFAGQKIGELVRILPPARFYSGERKPLNGPSPLRRLGGAPPIPCMDTTLSAVTIRPLKRADLPTIMRLLVATYHSNPVYPSHSDLQMGIKPGKRISEDSEECLKEHVYKHVGNRNHIGFVAADKDRILGFVLIKRHRPRGCPTFGELSDLILKPRQKSEGLGQMLIARAMAQFRAWEVDQVFLETALGNKSAHRFFIAQGFQAVSHTMVIQTAIPKMAANNEAIPSPSMDTPLPRRRRPA